MLNITKKDLKDGVTAGVIAGTTMYCLTWGVKKVAGFIAGRKHDKKSNKSSKSKPASSKSKSRRKAS